VRDLKKHFPQRGALLSRQAHPVLAVDGLTFDIMQGETLGLAGESGCGKTTAGRAILQLYRPSGGQVLFDGQDLAALRPEPLRQMRRRMQMIFQDPYASLNPRWTVSRTIAEPLRAHGLGAPAEQQQRVEELLEMVGLNVQYVNRYPHEFSGGQRQRIGIARALATSPDFIVCDEPISALDVSIQAQVVNLLKRLQKDLGLTYLFIAHDLSMMRHLCDRIAVMYLGRFAELADRCSLVDSPRHPYTQALISAAPIPDPRQARLRQRVPLSGDPPSPANPPSGCRFHPRCPIAEAVCTQVEPEWREVEDGHWVACHLT
jgi:oligopeptide transport system ATP-binding protein